MIKDLPNGQTQHDQQTQQDRELAEKIASEICFERIVDMDDLLKIVTACRHELQPRPCSGQCTCEPMANYPEQPTVKCLKCNDTGMWFSQDKNSFGTGICDCKAGAKLTLTQNATPPSDIKLPELPAPLIFPGLVCGYTLYSRDQLQAYARAAVGLSLKPVNGLQGARSGACKHWKVGLHADADKPCLYCHIELLAALLEQCKEISKSIKRQVSAGTTAYFYADQLLVTIEQYQKGEG